MTHNWCIRESSTPGHVVCLVSQHACACLIVTVVFAVASQCCLSWRAGHGIKPRPLRPRATPKAPHAACLRRIPSRPGWCHTCHGYSDRAHLATTDSLDSKRCINVVARDTRCRDSHCNPNNAHRHQQLYKQRLINTCTTLITPARRDSNQSNTLRLANHQMNDDPALHVRPPCQRGTLRSAFK